jgi:quinol monooxygenase YgiN
MIGVMAHLTIQDGKQAEFEAVVKRLVAEVNAKEPGCALYQCFKVQGSETEYMFLEQYQNVEATEAHRKSDHFRTLGKEMGPFLNGAPRIVRGDRI